MLLLFAAAWARSIRMPRGHFEPLRALAGLLLPADSFLPRTDGGPRGAVNVGGGHPHVHPDRREDGLGSLADRGHVCVWVDGVHFSGRLGEDDRLCCLVIVGVRAEGTKELVAITDGYRESTESWAELLRDCKGRPSSPSAGRRCWRSRTSPPSTRSTFGPPSDRIDVRRRCGPAPT